MTGILVADVTGTGPAVLLLHGQPGSAADWTTVSGELRSRFTVVVPDRRGYGRTGGRAVGFRANAEALIDLLDRLDLDRVVAVGHSWGGGVALALAELAPERVAGLVLVASVAPGERVGLADRLLAVRPVGTVVAAFAVAAASRVLSHPKIRLLVERHTGVDAAGLTGNRRQTLSAAWRQGGVARSFAVEQRALIDELDSLAPAMGALRVPTTVLAGTADRIVPPENAERLAAAIAGAELVSLPRAGHLLPFDHVDAIVAAVDAVAAGRSGSHPAPGRPGRLPR